jgi:hypothetical protein
MSQIEVTIAFAQDFSNSFDCLEFIIKFAVSDVLVLLSSTFKINYPAI